jgi:hypothetical protein
MVWHEASFSSLLVFNFALEYAIGMVQTNEEFLKGGMHQVLVYADYNLLGKKYTSYKKHRIFVSHW